MNNWRDETIK